MNVIVGLSGGVDSAVTAYLLQKQGFHVIGVHMRLWPGSPHHQPSPAKKTCYRPGDTHDQEDASAIARHLDIPFHIIDVSADYTRNVLDYFSQEYESGRTPNPCIVCNQTIKFDALLRETEKAGIPFDYFATGHYANTALEGTRWVLRRAKDSLKDQSYFLYRLSQKQLSQCRFPLGGYLKNTIKEIARKMELPISEKKESQNFVNGDYHHLLKNPSPPGAFVLENGDKIGEHRGIAYYTIGQRRGLGVAWTEPLFVIKIDAINNAVVLGPGDSLLGHELLATNIVWSGISAPSTPFSCSAKIRYASPDVGIDVTPIDETTFKASFHAPQKAITPGQSVVLYDGDKVLGGGIIA